MPPRPNRTTHNQPTEYPWVTSPHKPCCVPTGRLIEKLIASMENQEEHHKTLSFQDEYRSLLRKNGMIVDETYLWD